MELFVCSTKQIRYTEIKEYQLLDCTRVQKEFLSQLKAEFMNKKGNTNTNLTLNFEQKYTNRKVD